MSEDHASGGAGTASTGSGPDTPSKVPPVKAQEPYGSWRSPITADVLLQTAIGLGDAYFDGGDIVWLETRPEQRGRGVVVRLAPGSSMPVDVTPAFKENEPYFDVRTSVYSYGGGAWLVDNGTIYFSNRSDGRLYRQDRGNSNPVALTPAGQRPSGTGPRYLYADGVIDRRRNRWIGVREDWSRVVEGDPDEKKRQPVHEIVAVDLNAPDAGARLVAGEDFYAAPRLSPDGSWLAFVSWNHPQMPWQGTTLKLVELDDAGVVRASPVLVAGSRSISIDQPRWSPDGSELWFISDESGWWTLYRYVMATRSAAQVVALQAEFTQPQWTLAGSNYASGSNNTVVAAYGRDGLMKIAAIDRDTGRLTDIDVPYSAFSSVRADESGNVVFVAGSALTPPSVIALDLARGSHRVIKTSTTVADEETIRRHLSTAEPVTFPTTNGQHAHALFYPPFNADFEGPAGEPPPVVVLCHGGPTSQARTSLSLGIQYWTSRGIAILDINHRGSSGYGRAYRDLLEKNWGIIEVEDCIAAVRHLAGQGRVDQRRAVIKGGSAGGFTTLAALTFHNFFKAGSCHYGIGNLETLAQETHKFESHYLDWLIGPYPEQAAIYRARSPAFHVDRLSTPVIFFHGEDDPVVPPNQSLEMAESIKAKGLAFGCLLFMGEQHGIRELENQRRVIEAEHDFLSFEVFRTKMLLGQPKASTV